MTTNHFTKSRSDGFTLVEIAIVLLIVGLLLGGLLPTLSSQIEQRRVSDTRKQLDEIQQALIGFAITNGRLPCPADGTIATGLAHAGVEAYNGTTCTNVTGAGVNQVAWGVVPWATLGVSETDAWGRRFTYRVSTVFADSITINSLGNDNTGAGCTPSANPSQSSFALCSAGNLTVLSAATAGTNVAMFIPAVVVSHGTNGLGAYTSSGGTPIAGVTGDEGFNTNNFTPLNANNLNFVSHDNTPTFDDLVVWISPNTLMNRMVTAGKLP